jgi:hypothetical protein
VEYWVPQSDGTWVNLSGDMRLCLDDPGGITTNGWQLQVWGCNGQLNQQYFTMPG